MLKKILFAIFCLSLFGLTGCSYFDSKLAKKATQPTQREQTCAELKQEITFGGSDIKTDDNQRNMPNKEARSMQEYKKYRCKEFERAPF